MFDIPLKSMLLSAITLLQFPERNHCPEKKFISQTTKALQRHKLEPEEETLPDSSMQLARPLKPKPALEKVHHGYRQQECLISTVFQEELEEEKNLANTSQPVPQRQQPTRQVYPVISNQFYKGKWTFALLFFTALTGMASAQDDCPALNDWLPDQANSSGCCLESGITCDGDNRITIMYVIILLLVL
jgi:hypothetical protein